MHALIIEDEFLIADLIQDGLRDLGYQSFDIAESEAAAVKLAAERCPDLVTADDRLTDGSGVEAVRSICENRPIPVVFITGDERHIRDEVLDAIVVQKPFRSADLKDAVGLAITKRIWFRQTM
ncbi:response regulator [Sphingomonas piscis]|uniref:Response regulator n=1 Tax=Sphingomonas piscis TaxID=2714943 RepID=A0A6G7YPJ4_9SPHN|nr:response regulator [Sphingomonas piscis]QIK78662.1 response regulator [Sphingomonas piscis]